MATNTEAELRDRVSESAGQDASWQTFHVIDDQLSALDEDVQKLRSHPLIPDRVAIGGFPTTSTPACSAESSECPRSRRRCHRRLYGLTVEMLPSHFADVGGIPVRRALPRGPVASSAPGASPTTSGRPRPMRCRSDRTRTSACRP